MEAPLLPTVASAHAANGGGGGASCEGHGCTAADSAAGGQPAPAKPRKKHLDLSVVPDWGRRATRAGMSVMVFGLLGHCVRWPAGKQATGAAVRHRNTYVHTCLAWHALPWA